MAASRLLRAAAACVILSSFAAEDCKSYWGGCIQAAIVICQQVFALLALVIFFPFKIILVLQNHLYTALASRSGFGAAISDTIARSSIAFCNSVSADRIVMAGCVKVAWSQKYWEVLCASFVVHSSTGKCFVQALQYKVVEGSLRNTVFFQ